LFVSGSSALGSIGKKLPQIGYLSLVNKFVLGLLFCTSTDAYNCLTWSFAWEPANNSIKLYAFLKAEFIFVLKRKDRMNQYRAICVCTYVDCYDSEKLSL
jgi:hypothetical protein